MADNVVVDDEYRCVGLITVKDIQKRIDYPNATKDERGRLRVAAAVGTGVDTFERTTGEILEALRAARVSVKAAAMTAEILQACDLVKFAKHRPGDEETRRAVESAYRLVDETKPGVAAPVPLAAAAAGAGAGP